MSVPAAPAPTDRADAVICPTCSTPNADSARFCEACGTRLQFFCWSCGTAAPVGRHFCQQCGTTLAAPAAEPRPAAASPTIRMGLGSGAPALSAPVPVATAVAPAQPAIRGAEPFDLIDPVDGDDLDDQPIEERRVVSVLFADIVGFTTLSERLDPEDVRELSAAVLARLAEAVALYGGTIDKFMGDAIMALFGAPIAHEDDPIRAVRAALAMHQAVAALSQLDRDGNELELRLRIGINSGQVIAGVRDVGGHREYSVFGDVVNTAARLQTAAEPGGILLGEETARQAGDVFEVGAVESLTLKGKAQPVPAYQVRGNLTQDLTDATLMPAGGKRPLVGRLTELREIRRNLQELARGRGRLSAIIGEHGVGKTRLLAEARDLGAELGVHWIEATAPSHAQGLSYRLIREILTQLLGLHTAGSEARLVEELAERLERLSLAELAAPFGLVMGAESDMELTAGLSALQIQRKVLNATRRLLGTLLADRPMILVLDALQWADPSSIDLLIELMDLTDEAPILFVYVFTPDPDAPSWQLKEQAARSFPHRYVELIVGPLPERAARELMCSLLSCAETPAQVEELVLARTDGNPFFIEEVLRALMDSGALRFDGDRWIADRDIAELEIPNTLLAMVMARIDRLPAGVRRTLQIAAVIGREVSERVLRRVADGGPELDRHLREALRAGLLREAAIIPERRYAFTQALIHEAAARSLLQRRRKEIHVQVGWALEEIYADNLEGQYGELARHFWEGESWERAFRYSRLAAEQAAAAFANDEAVAAFTIALDSADRSAAGAAPKVVAMLAERRGDTRALLGEYQGAVDDYRSAIAHHLDELKDAADPATERAERIVVGSLALRMARLHSYLGQIDAARSKLALAFDHIAADSPDLSSLWSIKAASYTWDTDMVKAVDAGRRALQIARERGTFQHLGEAYEALTHPSMMGVLGTEIAQLADEWIGLARERPEDRQSLFKALTARGLVDVWVFWTFDEAVRAQTMEALEIAQATGSVAGENTARGVLGAGLFLLGDWAAAEVELRRAAGQATTILGVSAIYEWWLMLLLTVRGEAHTAADQMEIWLDDSQNPHRQILMRALLGFNRWMAGDADAARAAIARSFEIAATLHCAQCTLTLDSLAAEVLAGIGDAIGAEPHIANAREIGGRFGRQAAVLAAERADAVLALRTGRPNDARTILERARQLAETLGQPYEVARTLHLLAEAYDAGGNHFAAAPLRERVQELLDSLGAAPLPPAVRTMSETRLQV